MNRHGFWRGLADWESWWADSQLPLPIRPAKLVKTQQTTDDCEVAYLALFQAQEAA